MNYVVCFIKILQFKIEKFHIDNFKIFFWLNIRDCDRRVCLIDYVLNKHSEHDYCNILNIFFEQIDWKIRLFFDFIFIFSFGHFWNCKCFWSWNWWFCEIRKLWKIRNFFFFECWKESDMLFFFVRTFENSNDSKNKTNKTESTEFFSFWTRKFDIFEIEFFERIRNLNKFSNCSEFQFLIFFWRWFSKTWSNSINFTISKFFDDERSFTFEELLTEKNYSLLKRRKMKQMKKNNEKNDDSSKKCRIKKICSKK